VIKEEKTEAASSWFHANLKKVDAGDCLTYDPFQRLPQHAHASGVILAEAFLLTRHFHPSVALFAANIIQGWFAFTEYEVVNLEARQETEIL